MSTTIIPTGYKDTTIGIAPKNWNSTNLGDKNQFEIIMGQSPPSSAYNGNEDGLPFLQGNADFGYIYPNPSLYCSSPMKIAEKNDILMSVRAPVGELNLSPTKICIGRGLSAIRVKDGMDHLFLFYYLLLKSADLSKISSGSTFKAINKKDIESYLVIHPPLVEQRKIAAILSSVDAAIEQTDVIIAQTERMKKGLMQELFTKGIGHTEFQNTELGPIPKEWNLARLSEVCDFFDHLRVPVKESDRAKRKGFYPYYGAQGIIDWVDDFIFDGNYLLVAEDGENLRSKVLPIAYQVSGRFWVNNHAHILKPKENNSIGYIEYVLNFTNIDKYIIGSAQPKLNQEILRKIRIPWAGNLERSKIADILSVIDKKHNADIVHKEKLNALKKGLMQDLLTGRVRVKVDGNV